MTKAFEIVGRYNKLKLDSEEGRREKKLVAKYKDMNSYLGRLLNLKVALKVGNIGLVNKLLQVMINIDPIFLAEEIDRYIPFEKRDLLANEIIALFEELWSGPYDDNLKKIYFKTLNQLDDDRVRSIDKNIFGDFFFDELNFEKANYKYGIGYPAFWYGRIENQDLKKELLRIYFDSPHAAQITINEYFLFKYFFPRNDTLRKNILGNISGKINNLSLSELESLFIASENTVVKRHFATKVIEFKKPLFSVKKNLYLKEIEKNRCGTYCVFKLLELGYEDNFIMWWLL